MPSIRRQIRNLADTPLFKDNMWEIYNTDFPDSKILAQSVTFGYRTISVEEDKVLRKKYITGYQNPDNVTIDFIETEDFRVTKFFDKWEKSFLNSEGLFISGVDPRKNFVLSMFKFSGLLENIVSALTLGLADIDVEELTNIYSLIGLTPTERKPLDLKYDGGSDLYVIPITFSVDNITRLES